MVRPELYIRFLVYTLLASVQYTSLTASLSMFSALSSEYGSHLSSPAIVSVHLRVWHGLVSSVPLMLPPRASCYLLHVPLPYAQVCYSSRMRTHACPHAPPAQMRISPCSSSAAASGDPIDERRERMRLCSSFRMPPPPLLLLGGDVGGAGSRALSRALFDAPTGLRIADWSASAVGLFEARWDP